MLVSLSSDPTKIRTYTPGDTNIFSDLIPTGVNEYSGTKLIFPYTGLAKDLKKHDFYCYLVLLAGI